MSEADSELSSRLALVRDVIARSPEPLHVPLGLEFRPLSGASHHEAWLEHGRDCSAGSTYSGATLYVNVPFCARVCTFCLLSAIRLPSKDALAAYAGALLRHIELYAPAAERLSFQSLHVGGGTPTLLTEAQLDALLGALSRFPRAKGFQIGVEAHPASATPAKLAVLARHGVHRVSFGVETMTDSVLARVNRADQNESRVQSAISEARRLGFDVNVDLLAGLPGETPESFADTVKKALALETDSMSVNRFLGENSELGRFGFGPDARENERVGAMLLAADALIREQAPPRWPERPLARPGFGAQYVWDRSDRARRYFQNDMIGPVSTLAFGHGALGHLYGRWFTVPAGGITDYVDALTGGAPPAMLASPSEVRFERAFFVAEHASRGDLTTVDYQRVFQRDLAADFGAELQFLADVDLVTTHGRNIAKVVTASFQVTHLLAFLLKDSNALRAHAADLAMRNRATPGSPRDDALPRGVLRIDVGAGLDAEAAASLGERAHKEGLRVEVTGDERRETAQYSALGVELPPSMLWTRLAIRASQASRGEQRLVGFQ